jgi:hypothetical protein
VCANIVKVLNPRGKEDFTEEFKILYGIDTATEDPTLYPQYLCTSHASLFYSARRKGCESYKLQVKLYDYGTTLHCTSASPCSLCTFVCAGNRPLSYIEIEKNKSAKLIADICKLYKKLGDKEKYNCLSALLTYTKTDEIKQFVGDIGLACSIVDDIKGDAKLLSQAYKDPKYLTELNMTKYCLNRNPILLSFLCGIMNVTLSSLQNLDSKTALQLSCVIESVYKLSIPSFIGPASFMNNLTILQVGGSKLAVNIVGSLSAGGKYHTITSWLDNVLHKTELVCPKGDVVFIIDNEQRVGRTWSIHPNNKVKVSVITNVAVAQVNPIIQVQDKEELHPKSWSKVEGNEAKIEEMIDETCAKHNQFKRIHYEQLYHFIDAGIEQVMSEQVRNGADFQDAIDSAVKNEICQRNFKECSKCLLLYEKTKRKCPVCKIPLSMPNSVAETTNTDSDCVSVTNIVTNNDKTTQPTKERSDVCHNYSHVLSSHKDGVPVSLLDPVFVNPNSMETISMVLRHIGMKGGLKRYGGNEREWTSISCDGLPYGMITKLKEEALVCALCGTKIRGLEKFPLHCTSHHPGQEEVAYFREFD